MAIYSLTLCIVAVSWALRVPWLTAILNGGAFCIALIVGLRTSGRYAQRMSEVALLTIAPITLASPLVMHAMSNTITLRWVWWIEVAGIGAYVVAAMRWIAQPSATRALVLQAERESRLHEEPRSRTRDIFHVLVPLIAVAILIVPRMIVPTESMASAWPDAHRQADALSAVVAVALAITWIAIVAAPAVRRPRARELPTVESLRTRIALAIVGAIALAISAWLFK